MIKRLTMPQLRQETSETSRIYHYEKSGFPVEIWMRKKWITGIFFSLTPNPMSFWRFADTPLFRTVQDPQNPRIFAKYPGFFVLMVGLLRF